MVTRETNLPLIAHYADCTPLFFYAPDQHIAMISHAGWRGTAHKIAAVSVKKMIALGCDSTQLIAVIGPSAGPNRYEVDPECASAFIDINDEQGPVARPIEGKKDKFFLDLWRANRAVMCSAGMDVRHISIAGLCTITYHDYFYSHRVQGNDRGSLAGVVMLK